MSYVVPLFGEGRERQRRRWRRSGASAVIAAALVLAVYAMDPFGAGLGSGSPIREPPGTVAVPGAAVFSQAPYLGVRCAVPNSIACDRVGLAVWLKRPAYSVSASLDGRRLVLDRFGDELIGPDRRRTEFDGYLRPAGITTAMGVRPIAGTEIWLGDHTPSVAVWVLINFGANHYTVTHERVPLSAGWG